MEAGTREDEAAGAVQRAFRCFRARETYFEQMGIRLAATSLQCAWRSHGARKLTTLLLSPQALAWAGNDSLLAGNEYYEMLGAKSARGSDISQGGQMINGELPPETAKAVRPGGSTQISSSPRRRMEAAVTTIQQAVRCHNARLTYYLLLGIEADFGDLSPPESAREVTPAETTSVGTLADQQSAAITIQCNFRCFLSRNLYYELLASPSHSLNASGDDEKVAASSPILPESLAQKESTASSETELETDSAARLDDAACTIQRSFRCFSGKHPVM
jgi:hypothetical protein